MPQQVRIAARTLLPTPTVDDPARKVYQIEYQAGELPPHFIYIPETEWTAAKEKAMIRADMEKRIQAEQEIITI